MKRILAWLLMLCLVAGAACAEEAGISQAQVIGWAERLLANEYVKGDVAGRKWNVEYVEDHYEAIAVDEAGNTLFMCAFLPTGQLIYLCNMAAGDTDCFVSETAKYTPGSEKQLELMAYALEAVNALTPEESKPLEALELESESDRNGESIYLNHFEAGSAGWEARRWVRIQVEPELRVTHYVDDDYFSADDVDRLEPGMG